MSPRLPGICLAISLVHPSSRTSARVGAESPFARACGAPEVVLQRPYWLVFGVATILESWGRLLHQTNPPLITRYATWLLGRNLEYSTEKARTRLGWSPGLSYEKAIEQTVNWFLRSVEGNLSAVDADGRG